MATSIELEDYDLKKNKVYLAISQSIDTVNFEQKKVCLVGDDNRCLYQEERKFCSQTFFLLYDLSSDSAESKTRQFEGSCYGDTNKLVFLVVDSTHIIATESTHLYNYDMSTHLIRLCPPKVLLHSENGLNEPKMINVAIRTKNAIFVV